MPYLIELPVDRPVQVHEFVTDDEKARILAQVFNNRPFERAHHGQAEVVADANCYTDHLPMNPYIAGVAGPILLTNCDLGYRNKHIVDKMVARFSIDRMDVQVAETHRPPEVKLNLNIDTCTVSIHGLGTKEGMMSVYAFIDDIKNRCDKKGMKMEVVHHTCPEMSFTVAKSHTMYTSGGESAQ